jgi:hypothetical protein
MPGEPMSNVSELPPEFWGEGMTMFCHHARSPWLSLVDPKRYADHCDKIQALGMDVIATAHSPLITKDKMDEAWALTRELPNVTPPPIPDQAVLDAVLGAMQPA